MGIFEKVLLAIAILVANGALLFFILRFLLWLAFPGKHHEAPEARPATGAARAAALAAGGQDVSAAVSADAAAQSPTIGGLPALTSASMGRPRAYPHRLLIGLPVILALFAGGVWLGSIVGGSGTATAATRTIHVTGRVVTVNKTTEVRVPAQTVKIKGSIVSVPATRITVPGNSTVHTIVRTNTQVVTVKGKTVTTSTTIAIPTTVTLPATTATTTVTLTVTDTTGSTSTSSTT